MATNDFIGFASAGSANIMSQADYAAAAEQTDGVQPGPASSALANKIWRQGANMAAALGNFIAAQGYNAIDDGDIAALSSALSSAVTVISGVNASASAGYLRFANGIQIAWGRASIPSNAPANGVAVTFDKPFSSEPNISFGTRFSTPYGWGYGPQATSRTGTGFTLHCGMSSGGTSQAWSAGSISYIAVGPWSA